MVSREEESLERTLARHVIQIHARTRGVASRHVQTTLYCLSVGCAAVDLSPEKRKSISLRERSAVAVAMGSHHRHLDDPFFPFPPPPPSSSCPFLDLDFSSTSPFPPLDDLFLPPSSDPFLPAPSPYPFLLRDLTDRVAALEIAVAGRRRPEPTTRRCTYVTEAHGRKVKWTSVEKPRSGDRTLKWEAEVKSPSEDGFDRKWKWEAKGGGPSASAAPRKLKWGAALKGKGCLEPWSQAYTWEEDFTASDTDDSDDDVKIHKNKTLANKVVTDKKNKDKKKEDKAVVNKEKKCPVATIKIEEIPDDNQAGCVAIRKVLHFLLCSAFRDLINWLQKRLDF